MARSFEDFGKIGKEQFEAASAASSSFAKGMLTIATEATDYSQRSIANSSANLQKLTNAKSLEDAFRIQSDYMRDAYQGFVAQTTKIGELYTNLAREAFKPVETAIAKVQPVASEMTLGK